MYDVIWFIILGSILTLPVIFRLRSNIQKGGTNVDEKTTE